MDILTARAINRALGTTLAPWDVSNIDEATIQAIYVLLAPVRKALPTSPAIEQRKAEIRTNYWRRFGMSPPVYH
jgi:hypothetical protein